MTGHLLVPEHINRFLVMIQGVNMTSPSNSFNVEAQAFISDVNTYVVVLSTDDDTLVTGFFYSILHFDETVLFETRVTYIDSDMMLGTSWSALDLSTKNFVFKSSLSFFYGLGGFSYTTNVTIDFNFDEATLKTSGSTSYFYFVLSYFNIRVRYCPLLFPYFSNVSMQCWDTPTDPTMYYNPTTLEYVPCYNPCHTCDPTNISLCLSCDPLMFRVLNGTDCPCMTGYY